eukprot:SAG31_NODE_965_length_10696_cov_10.487213_4_plen_117_part_00
MAAASIRASAETLSGIAMASCCGCTSGSCRGGAGGSGAGGVDVGGRGEGGGNGGGDHSGGGGRPDPDCIFGMPTVGGECSAHDFSPVMVATLPAGVFSKMSRTSVALSMPFSTAAA